MDYPTYEEKGYHISEETRIEDFVAFMLEHDSDRFNCGMRISIFNHLAILLAFLDFDTFSGGMSYRLRI